MALALDGEGGWSLHQRTSAPGLQSPAEGANPGSDPNPLGERTADAAACLEGMHGGEHSGASAEAGDASYEGAILRRSPPSQPGEAIHMPDLRLHAAAKPTAVRWRTIAAQLLQRGAGAPLQLATIFAVVAARSLLQDRMAALNGRTVEYVLKQDRAAFVRLIGLSVFQVQVALPAGVYVAASTCCDRVLSADAVLHGHD